MFYGIDWEIVHRTDLTWIKRLTCNPRDRLYEVFCIELGQSDLIQLRVLGFNAILVMLIEERS